MSRFCQRVRSTITWPQNMREKDKIKKQGYKFNTPENFKELYRKWIPIESRR